jgi:tRNA(Ile)-lysidine synthase
MISFEDAIAGFEPELPLAVGFSGGADSTALLVACARRWPGQVVAIHINHQLQPAAVAFEHHCEDVCRQLGVPLWVKRVDARAVAGQSPEDAARIARYQAFARILQEQRPQAAIKTIAIGHHLDDQLETLLMALARGAGLPGLSAMASRFERHGARFVRPLLNVAGAEVRRWLQAQGVAHVEDPTNAETHFIRNRVRQLAVPAVLEALPSLLRTLPRSLGHMQEATQLLEELAALDLERCLDHASGQPIIQALQQFSRMRQGNLLRHWLKQNHGAIPSSAQIAELLDQVQACTTKGHRIELKVATGRVLRQGPCLAWLPIQLPA